MTERHEVGPRSQHIVAQERRHVAPGSQSFALMAGLAMARGSGSTLIDEDGNEYIDFIAGIAVGSVGHCHPHYVEALKRQVERLTFGSFTTETRAKFLELLASVTPAGLTRIQMFSGGAEAVEAALRLAKAATGKAEVVGFWGGFHGKTGGVLGLVGSEFKHHLGPFTPGRYLSPYADCYRCPLKLRYPDCGIACAEFVRDVIRYQTAGEVGGKVMLTRLEALTEKYRCVGEVRGRGLMLGIELVRDRTSKEPLPKTVTQALYQECLRRGLVAMTYSPSIRINPPLVIREEQALAGLAILDEALDAVVREHGLQ